MAYDKSDALLCCSLIESLYAMVNVWKKSGRPVESKFRWEPPEMEVVSFRSPLIWAKERKWNKGNGPRGQAHWEVFSLPMLNVTALKDGRLLVAIRGTNAAPEWFTDTNFIPVKRTIGKVTGYVHDGFDYCFKSFAGKVTDTVAQMAASLPGGAQGIVITGHSLGGALASLVALSLEASEWFAASKLGKVQAYLFAAPKVGNASFATSYNALSNLEIFNIQNKNDIVPHVPPDVIGFRAVGDIREFDKDFGCIAANHVLDSYVDAVTQGLVPFSAALSDANSQTRKIEMAKVPTKPAAKKAVPAKKSAPVSAEAAPAPVPATVEVKAAPAKKAVKKPAAKKAVATKAPAKKAPAKKVAVKKAAAPKKAAVKKAAPKKAVAKKAPAKKAPAKKAVVAKKAAVKKAAPAKKPAAKKA